MALRWFRFHSSVADQVRYIRHFLPKYPFISGCVFGGFLPVLLILAKHLYTNGSPEETGLFLPPDLINPVNRNTISNGHKILCIVTTHPSNYKSKVVHIRATWSRRCNHIVYLSTRDCGLFTWNCETIWQKLSINQILGRKDAFGDGELLDILEVGGYSGRKQLWQREKIGFQRIWEEFKELKDFDFILKTDDDSFIVIENLKHLLQPFNPQLALIVGHYQKSQGVEYMSGGSGYAISREGFRRLIEEGFPHKCDLPYKSLRQSEKSADEDLQMGVCAKLLEFQVISSDVNGGMTFIPFQIQHVLLHQLDDRAGRWFREHSLECKHRLAKDCLSEYPIAFHYIQPVEMYKLEYLIYTSKLKDNY